MRNLNISTKLIILITFTSIITAFIGYNGVSNLYEADKSLEHVFEDSVLPMEELKNISDTYAINVVDAAHKVRSGQESWWGGSRALDEAREVVRTNWEAYLNTNLTEREEMIVSEIEPLMEEANSTIRRLDDIFSRQDTAALAALISNELYSTIDPVTNEIAKLVELQHNVAEETFHAEQAAYNTTFNSTIAIIVLGILLAIGFAIFIIRSVNSSIQQGVGVIKQLSQGDLTVNVAVDSEDEIGEFMGHLKVMVNKVRDVIGQIYAAAENVSSGSTQLSSMAEQLSSGTTEQASNVEEVSTTMEQMNATVSQNSENAKETESMAQQVSEDAEEVGTTVEQSVGSLQTIAEKVKFIDEIARQTDLLALNAAIEAARAGDSGRGFAVVAEEIRKLAERAQNNASEINSMSEESVKVSESSREKLNSLLPKIQKTTSLVQEISASSGEQSSGIDQVTQAVRQLDTVIQQNASGAEQLASTSEELSSQSQEMVGTVQFFKFDRSAVAVGSHQGSSSNGMHGNGYGKSGQRKSDKKAAKQNTSDQKKASKDGQNGDSQGIDLDLSDSEADKHFS